MSDKSKLAYPVTETDKSGQIAPTHRGMTLREYTAIKLSAAWVIALSQRHNEEGYSDHHCKYVANKRAIEQADALIEALQEAGE